MNLYEFCFKLTHFRMKNHWVETVATFTGETEDVMIRSSRTGGMDEFRRYRIYYEVDGNLYKVWYQTYLLAGEDTSQLAGKTTRIRYKKKKPYIFEMIEE